ncbi:geranylgeranyl transferase type-1 subunit beta [Syncephalis fuscata]|nr:geranylgeranyl transferase type-1 subunit beta [Syncephalis fuscata]
MTDTVTEEGYLPNIDRHINYFLYCVNFLPQPYTSGDTTRLTLISFGLCALEYLNVLESRINSERRQLFIDWIYDQQIAPSEDKEKPYAYCGFRGGPFTGPSGPYNRANVAATFGALTSLLALGDDLSRVDRAAIAGGLREIQLADGRFAPMPDVTEADMRLTYCAVAICYILNDWSGIDRERTLNYVWASQNYDGGFAQAPGEESHGGLTFCAVAILYLLGELDTADPRLRLTKRWGLARLSAGYQGRVNKPTDTCYSFWVGATLKLLDVYEMADHQMEVTFLHATQSNYGGFSKWVDQHPDLLHAYLGLIGLSLATNGVPTSKLSCALAIPPSVVERLTVLHK